MMQSRFVMESPRYTALCVELVADALALVEAIHQARPDTAQFTGPLMLTFDMSARQLNVGIKLDGERVVLIEAIAVDPDNAATFGESIRPIAVTSGVTH